MPSRTAVDRSPSRRVRRSSRRRRARPSRPTARDRRARPALAAYGLESRDRRGEPAIDVEQRARRAQARSSRDRRDFEQALANSGSPTPTPSPRRLESPRAPKPSALDFVRGATSDGLVHGSSRALALVCAAIAVAYGLWLTTWLLRQPAGNERMQEISRRRAGRRVGLPAAAVHDDRDRRGRAVPPARLLQQARLGDGVRLPDRRGALGRRRLHRHERRRPLERPHGRGGARRPRRRR